ncbi:hypothetical protein V6D40_08435 [Corynebacterium sp. Q4381]|uniref:hypothetical protein n=1 Tax=Corynebacterium sp. Marseille-Q4381 TaxID=3121597 RepID=UPI002FE51AA0
MEHILTNDDHAKLDHAFSLLTRAGVRLAEDIEPDDIEDAIADDPAGFRTAPLTTLAGLCDPDAHPLIHNAVISGGDAGIPAVVERFARAAGVSAHDIAVMSDPGSDGASGSVRIRFDEWDVADIDYDFSGSGQDFELDVVAAALPVGAMAATFPTPDGRDVTLFLPAGADEDAVDALIDAIEAEFA